MVCVLFFAFSAFFFYQWQEQKGDVMEAFARSFVLFSVVVLVITNVLSVFGACTKAGLFVCWLLAAFVTITLCIARFGFTLPASRAQIGRYLKTRLSECSWIEKLMLLLCLFLCLVLFIGALFTVPANYDSMTYHLGRIGHWIDNRSVNHFVTDIDRQLYSPVLAEYYLLHLMLLTGSDTFVNFLQYVSMLVCALFLYRCARELHTSRLFSTFAVFLFLTMPLTISQSVTTQNDLFAASIFSLFLYYFLWFINREKLIYDKEEVMRLICIGILVGLAYITKTSVCASMLMFMPWLLIVRIRRKDSILSLVKAGLTALLSMLVIISESMIRNVLSCGKIMPETASSNIMVATKNVRYIVVNILKNFALITTQHLSDALNGFMCRVAIRVGAFLHVEVNNEAISFHGFDFIQHMNRGDNMYSHDVTPSAFVGYLSALSGVVLLGMLAAGLIKALQRSVTSKGSGMTGKNANTAAAAKENGKGADKHFAALTLGFGISDWLSFGFIMALLRWQPWGTRLMYPALAMMVIMIANMLDFCLLRAREAVRCGVLLCLIVSGLILCYPSLLYNMAPAADNLKGGCTNRLERYFVYNERYETYEELADYVTSIHKTEDPFTLGVYISGDGYDYPLWLVFRDRMPQAFLQHVRFDAPDMVPDAPEILLWIEKDRLQVGDTLDYGDQVYECVFVSSTRFKDAVLVIKH